MLKSQITLEDRIKLPKPKIVSSDHIWYNSTETAIVEDFLSKKQIATLNRIIIDKPYIDIKMYDYKNHNIITKNVKHFNAKIFTFVIEPGFEPQNSYLTDIYWSVLDKVRAIHSLTKYENERRWGLELRGLSPNATTGINRMVDSLFFDKGNFMDWHSNCTISTNWRRKLAVYIPLTDSSEYEGGELEVFAGPYSKIIPMVPGSLIAFPALRYMRIKPITEKSMRMLCIWINGAQGLR